MASDSVAVPWNTSINGYTVPLPFLPFIDRHGVPSSLLVDAATSPWHAPERGRERERSSPQPVGAIAYLLLTVTLTYEN